MSDSHFVGAHTPVDLRPIGDTGLHALMMGDQRVTADRAGLERLWDVLDRALGKTVHNDLEGELVRLETLAGTRTRADGEDA